MMDDKLTAQKKISELIRKFEEQYDYYKNSDYNETQTRNELIDPFFYALGWDMYNESNYAESYREVIHEDKLKIEGVSKAPDYSFRLVGGKRLFFVEAKKPSISVKEGIQPAYQVRRYGWSAKHPISIITDFEEFSVYDCTKKPNPYDKPSVARIKYLTYRDYPREFDFIWETFSKEHVLKGSFDKFVQSDAPKRGTTTVDKDFLESLDRWRTYLATNISWNNKNLDEDEINFAVQQIIDRLIFLRIAEDRRVEPYGSLKHVLDNGEYYYNLFLQFKRADEKYNSGLFDFKKDRISESLKIENKVLKTIINELYYPDSPYEFSVLPVEILGSVYEQFLGKVIRITPAHHAKVEEKPEVRKAGGVYYTPQYIVEYIVKNTVGKLIKGKTPDEISSIKIVDPACGSGSFLIGALQYLFDYHRDYYISKDKQSKGGRDNPMTPDGLLTTSEKKRILLNNIFGVDLDANAVEVTKLSLLLKCLEGETDASINHQLILFNERVLPTLDCNIKNGNSLIDTDYYDNQLDFGEEKKIRPFNWQKAFPEVFKQGGFDVVIGNPPYIRLQGLLETQPLSVDYYRKCFKSANVGNFDLYVLFDERGLNLLNDQGILGYIQPHKFFQADFGVGIRDLIAEGKYLQEVVHFSAAQVFKEATTYTCLLFLSKKGNKDVLIRLVKNLDDFIVNNSFNAVFTTPHPEISEKWNFTSSNERVLINKLKETGKTIGDVTRKIFVGLQTSADKVFVLETINEGEHTITAYSKSLDQEVEIEKGLVKPFLMGKDIRRYQPLSPKHFVIFPYQVDNNSARLMTDDFIMNSYPLGWNYIIKNKKELEGRENGKMKGDKFYAYIYPKNLIEFEVEKICTPDIANYPKFTIDKLGRLYHTTTVYSFAFHPDLKENKKFILGVLNSPIMWFFLKSTGNVLRGGFFRFKTEYLKPFPIRLIDFNKNGEVIQHDEIVKLVDQLLMLNEEKVKVKLQTRISEIESKIDYCEKRINEIVYQLYGLTEDEIRIVESSKTKS